MKQDEIKKIFEDIYEDQADSLFRYTFFRVSNRAQALDIVQDVFAVFWQSLNKGTEIKNHNAFLFTILRNRIIDWYRKKKSLSLDRIIENSMDGQTFEIEDIKASSVVVMSAEAREIIETINTLSPEYRECVYLRLVEDLSPEDIGKRLGIKTNAASVRINRGIEKIRNQLKI